MLTQGKLITQSQAVATNLAPLQTMVEEVLYNDHDTLKLKRFLN
jgi:hypothetical protein